MTALRNEIFEVLRLLSPCDLKDHTKRRLGPKNDGGYVVINSLVDCSCVYSFGAGSNGDFELTLAELGKDVYLFDSVMTFPPKQHPKIFFRNAGLAKHGADASGVRLDQLLGELGHADRTDMILKLNIEGDEWGVIPELEPALPRFRQVIIELHWLMRMIEPEFRSAARRALQVLRQHFVISHVHANNNRPVGMIDGFPVPDVVELTCVRCGVAEVHPSATAYPTALDAANNPDMPDHLLLFYPFAPAAAELERRFEEAVRNSSRTFYEKQIRETSKQILDCENQLMGLRRLREELWSEVS